MKNQVPDFDGSFDSQDEKLILSFNLPKKDTSMQSRISRRDSVNLTIKPVFRPLVLAVHFAFAGVLLPQFFITTAHAQQAATAGKNYNIPAGPLANVLTRFIGESGILLSGSSELAKGKTSPGLSGNLTVSDALSRLLAGTGIEAAAQADGSYILRTSPAASSTLPAVTVTASNENPGDLPNSYAGGQVATGGRAGLLGNRDVMDLPFNVTNFTQKTIQDQQARSVADVVQNDPSVRMVSPSSNGSEVFSIRGFPLTNQDISFDGMYGILPYWRGSVAAAERVEVLKGPNAFLNGMAPSGGVGGGINIVPKRASDESLTQLTATYIADSNVGGQIDVGRRFGPDNRLGLRVNGVYRDGDTNRTEQEHGELTVALDYRGDSGRLFADFGYQKLKLGKVEGLLGLAAGASVPVAPKADKTYFQPWTSWENDTTYGVVRGELDLTSDLTVFAAIGARHFRDDYLFPFGFGLNAQGNFTEGFAYSSSWYNSVSAEAGLRGRLMTGNIKHQFSLVVTNFTQESGVISGAAPVNPSNIYNPSVMQKPNLPSLSKAGKTGEIELSSLAIADTISVFDDKLQITIGARSQKIDVDSFNGITGVKSSPSYSKDAVTPSLGVVIKPVHNVSLYGNYIEGLSQGQTAPIGTANFNTVLAPYKSKQVEAGVKVDFGDITTTVSLFQIKRPSAITDPVTLIYSADGEQRNRGVEVNVFGEVAKGVRLLGGLMLLDAEQTKTNQGTFDGKKAVNAPRAELNLCGEWDTPFFPGLTLTARGIYTDSAYVNAANTQEIPSWSRFDFGTRYVFKPGKNPVTVRANIENLFDRTYWMSSSLYRGNPRTFTLSTTIDF